MPVDVRARAMPRAALPRRPRGVRGAPWRSAFLLLLLSLSWAGSAFPSPLEVPGTGACEAVLGKLAAAFNARHPGYAVAVPPSTGSGGGIRAVMEGEAALARVARPLEAGEAGAGLRYRAFARDAVVFAVGRDVTVESLTWEELAAIFSGRIKSWDEVGGPRAPIRLLLREEGDSSLREIRRQVREFREISFDKGAKVLYHDREMVEMLTKYRTAIGWLTLSSLEGTGLRPLSLNGVAPTARNVASGRYWLTSEYAFVYREERLAGAVRAFVDFTLYGPGRRILEDSGLAVPEGP